jgi:hypothetical protein
MMRRLLLALTLLLCATSVQAQYTSIIVDEGFTNAGVTCTSTGNGAWSSAGTWSCGREPNSSDWVQINHAVTITGTRNAWTVYIASGGSLTCSPPMTLTFSNTAFEASTEFYTGLLALGTFTCAGTSKTTWARTTAGISNGATSITVDACPGWANGDRIVIGDTRERDTQEALRFDQFQPEVVTISSIASCVVTFSPATTHAYTTARDHNGTVERTIPVGNLTRDIVFKSASAGGTRAHLLFDKGATVDFEYAAVQDMGRTTIAPVGVGNHIGRYPVHLHHTDANATIRGLAIERSKKWPITIHDTDTNTVTLNTVYDGDGWGIGTEIGTENDNVIDNNFVALIWGPGFNDNGGSDSNRGTNGSCFWFEGPSNYVRFNVGIDCENTAYALWNRAGDHDTRNLTEFHDNEAIACTEGFTWWDPGDTDDIVDNLYEWHSIEHGFYGYGVESTFTDFYSRGDPSRIGARTGKSNWFGDYDITTTNWIRPNIQNKDVGLHLPYGTANAIVPAATRYINVTDAYMYNEIDFSMRPLGLSGTSNATVATITSATHGNASGEHYRFEYSFQGDIVRLRRLIVANYNGTGVGFEVYATEQAAAFMIPQSPDPMMLPYGGCPAAGLTNQGCWDMYGKAVFGAILPVGAHSHANVFGLVVDAAVTTRPRLRKRLR